jgi:hypothetical protein
LDPRFSHNHCQDTEKECKDNFKVHFALNFTQVNKQLDAKPNASFKIRVIFFHTQQCQFGYGLSSKVGQIKLNFGSKINILKGNYCNL